MSTLVVPFAVLRSPGSKTVRELSCHCPLCNIFLLHVSSELIVPMQQLQDSVAGRFVQVFDSIDCILSSSTH